MVKILLEHNADINLSDHRKETPLMYAVDERNTKIVELLLKYKPDLTLKNESGKTALDIAYNRNNYVKKNNRFNKRIIIKRNTIFICCCWK